MEEKKVPILIKQFRALKREIAVLRNKLNQINQQKEEWFRRKENLKRYVLSLIKKVRGIKIKKDTSNIEIEELKRERDKCNAKVRELIYKIKDLYKEKKIAFKKYNIRVDPSKIKERMERLEFIIETEALSFEKEKKIMEEIKRLKKIYEECSKVKGILDEINKISEEIRKTRQAAEEFHRKIQEYIKENRGGYSEFIDISNRITHLKTKQERAFETFINLKKEFWKINSELKNKLAEANQVQDLINNYKKAKEEKKQKEVQKVLEEKEKEVEEKLKNKKKLTTQDLLVFQKGENE